MGVGGGRGRGVQESTACQWYKARRSKIKSTRPLFFSPSLQALFFLSLNPRIRPQLSFSFRHHSRRLDTVPPNDVVRPWVLSCIRHWYAFSLYQVLICFVRIIYLFLKIFVSWLFLKFGNCCCDYCFFGFFGLMVGSGL